MTEEEAQDAKDLLDAAIKRYFATVEPDVYIDSWVLISHKMSTGLEQQNATVTSRLVPTHQVAPMTLGLMTQALIVEAFSFLPEYDDEDEDDD